MPKKKPKMIDTVRDLLQLADAARVELIGEKGPLMASGGNRSLFNALFGRDSLRTAHDLARYHPEIGYKTLIALAALQGTKRNNKAEEESGKIIHEYRLEGDRMRKILEKHWAFPYYGSVDSTPMFVYLLAVFALKDERILHEKVTLKNGQEITLLESLVRSLKYILRKLSESKTGLLEWSRINKHGLINQAWKDSQDSYHHEDSTLANHDEPIASVEVQGYVHNAIRKSLELFRVNKINPNVHGLPSYSQLEKTKNQIAKKIIKFFWMQKKQYFALGLDYHGGKPVQLDIITSNVGHLLDTTIFNDVKDGKRYLHAIIEKLFSKEMFCFAGIRTLNSSEKRYHPWSYHNGSVWPFDNGLIADGLRRYGYHALATEVEYRILRSIHETGSNVEFFRGDSLTDAKINPRNSYYKDADGATLRDIRKPQMNQAWTTTRVYIIERRMAEDFYLKTKTRPHDAFEKKMLLRLKSEKNLYSTPEI